MFVPEELHEPRRRLVLRARSRKPPLGSVANLLTHKLRPSRRTSDAETPLILFSLGHSGLF